MKEYRIKNLCHITHKVESNKILRLVKNSIEEKLSGFSHLNDEKTIVSEPDFSPLDIEEVVENKVDDVKPVFESVKVEPFTAAVSQVQKDLEPTTLFEEAVKSVESKDNDNTCVHYNNTFNGLKKYDNVGYFFVLPFVIVFCIFSVYPVLRTLYFSFTNAKIAGVGVTSWVWFDNYKRVFTDKFFWRALWNTVRIWGVNIVLQLGLAFLLTIVFSDIKYKIKGLGIFRIIYYLPNLIAATSVAFLFQTLLDWRYGTFNQIIASIYRLFGANYTPVDWLGSSATAGVTIAVISSWMWFGNSFIMLMAGVQGISKDYFEAAAIDGAGRWTVFGKITLPLLRPMLLYVAITSLIGGLQMFDLPYLMSNPAGASYNSVYTVVMYLYKFGFTTGTTQTGYASAIAYVLFLIILAVSIIQLKVFNQDEEKAAARRAKKRASSKTK